MKNEKILKKKQNKVLFLPKLQSYFAEFLQYGYLSRFSFFNLPTCVGLRYGFKIPTFSWKINSKIKNSILS
jgi:hypothetical protein